MSLHWLRIPERIQFKLAVLVHRVLHANAPEYLGPFTRLSDVPSRSSVRSSSSNHLLVPPFVARLLVQGRFRWPGQLCQFFVIILNIICSLISNQALFNNCTILYRGLEAFYIALGHVNPIGNYYYYYYYY